jgi:hypothetical protein
MYFAEPVIGGTVADFGAWLGGHMADFGTWLPDHIYEVLTFAVGAVVLLVAVATLVVAWKTLRSADEGAKLTKRTIALSEEAGRLAQRSVDLAEEAASERPALKVELQGLKNPLTLPRVLTDMEREEARQQESRKRQPGLAGADPYPGMNEKSDPHGYVHLSVTNTGKLAATGVHGWLDLSGLLAVERRGFRNTSIRLRSDWSIPREGMDPQREQVQCRADELLPHGGNETFSIPVAALAEGEGAISYRFVCNEGCETEGSERVVLAIGEPDED